MGCEMVIAPSLAWEETCRLWSRPEFLVLDRLLLRTPETALVFRRLRLRALLFPAERAVYEAIRHEYLRDIFRMSSATFDGVVVVGSHAQDVDLLDVDSVTLLSFQERELRAISKRLYGEPMLLVAEYACVTRALEDAVDDVLTVPAWAQVPAKLVEHFPGMRTVDLGISDISYAAAMLSHARDFPLVEGWCPYTSLATLYGSGPDYDYLGALRQEWRDAVACFLGASPRVVDLIRVPWFVVDPVTIDSLCARPGPDGIPRVATRGDRLLDFVRERLASALVPSDLVGSWVGGLLCDDDLAVKTLIAAGYADSSVKKPGQDESMALTAAGPVVARGGSGFPEPQVVQSVMADEHWAYAAVPGVVPCGEGEYPVLPVTYPFFVMLLSSGDCTDMAYRSSVVTALYVLEAAGVSTEFVTSLVAKTRLLRNGVLDPLDFDSVLVPFIPGYFHLGVFPDSLRGDAFSQLGRWPAVDYLEAFVDLWPGARDLGVSMEMMNVVHRAAIFARRPLEGSYLRFGSVGGRAGLCYLEAFAHDRRDDAFRRLGTYPCFADVCALRAWWRDDAMDSVMVVSAVDDGTSFSPEVIHFVYGFESLGAGLPKVHRVSTLRSYMQMPVHRRVSVRAVRVGGVVRRLDGGQCVSNAWMVAAIIAWTVVAVMAVFFMAYLLYRRCVGGISPSRRRF